MNGAWWPHSSLPHTGCPAFCPPENVLPAHGTSHEPPPPLGAPPGAADTPAWPPLAVPAPVQVLSSQQSPSQPLTSFVQPKVARPTYGAWWPQPSVAQTSRPLCGPPLNVLPAHGTLHEPPACAPLGGGGGAYWPPLAVPAPEHVPWSQHWPFQPLTSSVQPKVANPTYGAPLPQPSDAQTDWPWWGPPENILPAHETEQSARALDRARSAAKAERRAMALRVTAGEPKNTGRSSGQLSSGLFGLCAQARSPPPFDRLPQLADHDT